MTPVQFSKYTKYITYIAKFTKFLFYLETLRMANNYIYALSEVLKEDNSQEVRVPQPNSSISYNSDQDINSSSQLPYTLTL